MPTFVALSPPRVEQEKYRDLVPGGRKRRTNDEIAADNARDAAAQPGVGNFFKPASTGPKNSTTEPTIPEAAAAPGEELPPPSDRSGTTCG